MISAFRILLSLWLAWSWTERTLAEIKQDGMCNVAVLASFVSNDRTTEIYGLGGDQGANLGFLQVATALLAVRHFNNRDAIFVPQLANISSSCNVKLNISNVLNAVPGDDSAIRWIARNSPPCAIAGGNDDYTGNEVKVIAKSLSIPFVTTGTFDPAIASDEFVSSMFPNLVDSAYRIVQYLLFKNRTNYISFLYEESTGNLKRLQAITNELDTRNIKRIAVSFSTESEELRSKSVYNAMKRIKEIGYRTIIIAQENPWICYQLVADAAEELEMNRGDHFYIWYDVFEPTAFQKDQNENSTKLVAGSAWIVPIAQVVNETVEIWQGQGEDIMKAVMALDPFGPGEVGYVEPVPDFFQNVLFQYSCPEMYDAIMSIGIGACNAQATSGSEFVSGADHQRSIRKAEFLGFSGLVNFDLGRRSESTVFWGSVNFLANKSYTQPEWIVPKGYKDKGYEDFPFPMDSWFSLANFVYADGTTTAPPLLRDTPEQNYVWVGLRIVGFTLLGINVTVAIFCAGWVFIRRKHRIVTASQPEFLYLICFGALVQTSAILPASFDESNGWSTGQLSEACMAIPWLFTLGYMIVYSSLFTKLWRINKVLQFARRRIKIQHVVWPMAILFVVELLLLILWTVLDPLQWERVEINSITGESMGSCQSNNAFAFVAPLAVVMLVPSLLTLYMAWKTKDVDETLTESRWIFILILLQIEVTLVAVPVMVILSGKSSNGKYLGGLIFYWSFPMTTLGLIFFPKIVAYRRAVRGEDGPPKYKRGQRGNSRVSGDYMSTIGGARQTNVVQQRDVTGTTVTERSSEKHSSGVEGHGGVPAV